MHILNRAWTVAFQVLDGDGDGFLSYTDLFGLYRLITGPTFRDDDVLSIIASILNGQELQQPGKISFDEFVEVKLNDQTFFAQISLVEHVLSFNPFTPDSAKSKIDKFSKINSWVKLKNKQQHY